MNEEVQNNKVDFTYDYDYLDIGANHCNFLSSTIKLYKEGQSGVLIEPDPELYEEIVAIRPRDLCLNCGVGSTGFANFYIMENPLLNTFSKEIASFYSSKYISKIKKITTINLIPLEEIFYKYFKNKMRFLTLESERVDLEEFKKNDFNRFSPETIIIETLNLNITNSLNQAKQTEIINFLLSFNYKLETNLFSKKILVKI